CSLGHWYFDVW
nr:immunoglobulin heavy chain junction region [Mus musculus]MBK4188184.1 immunoglobulin heavy chain junction region [Mus musculus]